MATDNQLQPAAITTVVGATTWGTALGIVAARMGNTVRLLCRTAEEADGLRRDGEHTRRLPGNPFPMTLSLEHDPATALGDAQLIIVAVPSDRFRQNLQHISRSVPADAVVLSVTKGFDRPGSLRMTEVMAQELPQSATGQFAVLSGPSLADEVIAEKPVSVVAASQSDGSCRLVQDTLTSPMFRIYTSEDVVGVELGGALKNIVALAGGIADGLGVGDSAKAALITRGLAEISRLGIAAGAHPLTFAGLAGLGDVMATCSSPYSRNRSVGEQLGKGRRLEDILAGMDAVAEGVNTTLGALELAERLAVEMPIAHLVSQVLFEDLPASDCIPVLMARPPRAEW